MPSLLPIYRALSEKDYCGTYAAEAWSRYYVQFVFATAYGNFASAVFQNGSRLHAVNSNPCLGYGQAARHLSKHYSQPPRLLMRDARS